MKKLRPDFKTIADFRKENVNAFKKVFRQYTIPYHDFEMFARELVTIDGTKIKGVNNIYQNYPKSLNHYYKRNSKRLIKQ